MMTPVRALNDGLCIHCTPFHPMSWFPTDDRHTEEAHRSGQCEVLGCDCDDYLSLDDAESQDTPT